MSDISEQQMIDIAQSLNKASGSLGKIADRFGSDASGKANAVDVLSQNLRRKATNDDTKGLKDHYTTLNKATKTSESFLNGMNKLAGMVAGGWIIKEMIDYGQENVETYRNLTKVGQSFGGSMLKMTQQAAAAGMPLEQFARIIKNNSVVVAKMGTDSFFKLNKEVRKLVESSGMYGMSMEELGEFTGGYLETQRLAGKNISALSSQTTKYAVRDFALNLTTMSGVMGTSTETIMDLTNKAMRDSTVVAQMRINTAKGMGAYNDAMNKAITSLAAQPGQAGQMLSKGLADAFGNSGGAIFTDLGKAFTETGQTFGTAMIDDANRRIAAGENQEQVTMDLVNNLKKQLDNPETLESLKLLASVGGEAAGSAKDLLALTADLTAYSQADVERRKKEKSSVGLFTAFFASFESVFGRLKGALIDGFLSPFLNISGQLDPEKTKKFWDSFQNIEPVLKQFGEMVGQLIATAFTPENVGLMVSGITKFVQITGEVIKFGSAVVGGLSKVFGGLYDMASKVNKTFAGVVTAGAMLAAWFGGKALIRMIGGGLMSFLTNGRSRVVTVSGQVVNVNGGGGGAGGLVDDLLDGGGKAARGGRGAAARAATAAARRGGVRGLAARAGIIGRRALSRGGIAGKLMAPARGLGRIGAKLGLRGAGRIAGNVGGRFLPGIGVGLNAMGAYTSAKDGNYLASGLYGAGAGLGALATGLDATGIGALAGVPLGAIAGVLGAGGLAADMTGFGKGWFGKKGRAAAPTARAPARTAAVAGSVATASTPSVNAAPPAIIDDEMLVGLRSDALLGNQNAINEMKRINEGLEKQTMMLYSVARKNLEEQKRTGAAIAQSSGY